jgi:hypothetical protein
MDEELNTYPVREDMRFQNAAWVIERVTWVLLALVPLAALAGVFSHGPLSERTAQAPDSAWSLEYERFQRVTVQSRFLARIPSATTDEIRLRLSPSFQLTYDIQSMQPEPMRSTATADGLELDFPPVEGELAVVIWATPRQFGSLDLRAETDGGAIEIPVLIYP